MFEKIISWFLNNPVRMISWGYALVQFAIFLLCSGLLGRVATSMSNMADSIIHATTPVKMLSEIYPSLPVWWVPETGVGVLLTISIFLYSGPRISDSELRW